MIGSRVEFDFNFDRPGRPMGVFDSTHFSGRPGRTRLAADCGRIVHYKGGLQLHVHPELIPDVNVAGCGH